MSDDLEFLQRVWKHRAKIGFHRELSVLKFPSAFWRMYSLSSGFSAGEIRERHGEGTRWPLRRELLEAFVSEVSTSGGVSGKKSGFAETAHGLIRYALRLYGYQRWPLNRLAYRRYRRRAGLPAKK